MTDLGLITRARRRLQREALQRKNNVVLRTMACQVSQNLPEAQQKPIVFFNASTRLSGLSLNAGFSILTAWSLGLQGVPVVHFVCSSGLQPCVLGTNRKDANGAPPCADCIRQSQAVYESSQIREFEYKTDPNLDNQLEESSLDQLMGFEHQGVPLGELVLPSLRWILRRHNLADDEYTTTLYKNYIRSAWSLARQFEQLVKELDPQVVVLFNGMQYPEAVARWVARGYGIRVISHEVGMRPLSAYFTEGDATAYDLDIPADFQLNQDQNEKLDAYLSARFKGDFHMAGVKFWPEMSELSQDFQATAAKFKQVVPVFTNVIFDTSQPHANVLFRDMFFWLDQILEVAKTHPETLFVVRAHPDEARKGKASEESVSQWAQDRQLDNLPNVKFVPPQEYINSYDLIRMAKFVLIYNSTIGMEASILGAPVLSAGKARFTASDVVWFPQSQQAYLAQLEELLNAESVEVPERFKINARRFLYWQLYRSSLSFEEFLEPDGLWPGYVKLKNFDWQALLPKHSNTLAVIAEGLLREGDFMLKENQE